MAQTIQTIGQPMSRNALKSFLGGSAFLSSLIASQPAGDACAYYLNARDRGTRAFQLCFNSGQTLVAKAIISTSGSGSSTSANIG